MLEYNLPLAASDQDSAVAWYNQNLAKVLGVTHGIQTLQPEHLSALYGADQRRAIAQIVGKRFRRVIDDATGSVAIETIGDPFVAVEPTPDEDPQILEMTRGYVATARATIAAIDVQSAVAGLEPDDIASIVWQTLAVLDLLAAEAPKRRGTFLIFTYLHELSSHPDGLLKRLERAFADCVGEDRRTVVIERTITSIRAAQRAIHCFAEAITEYIGLEEEQTIVETVEIIRRCAGHIGAQVDEVRQELRRAGIGDCELDNFLITFDAPCVLANSTFDTISIADAFVAIKAEATRWMRFAERGRSEQIVAIRDSAIVLRSAVTRLQGSVVTERFKLDPMRGSQVAARIDRMSAYVLSVLDAIIGQPVARALAGDDGGGDGGGAGSGGKAGYGDSAAGGGPSRGTRGPRGGKGSERKGSAPRDDADAMPV